MIRGGETGGQTTHEERAEWAAAAPETRAAMTVRMAEEQAGARMPSWAIHRIADEALAYGNALKAIAAEREREETGAPLPFTLDEIADVSTARAGDDDEHPPAGGARAPNEPSER